MTDEMDCRKVFEQFSDLIDGEIDRATGEKIRERIESCPHCQVCFATFSKSVELFQQLGDEPAPTDLVNDLKAFIRANMPVESS